MSFIVGRGRTQEAFEHELPLRPGDGHRISLTFRSIVPGFEDGIGAAEEANACVARMGLTCDKR